MAMPFLVFSSALPFLLGPAAPVIIVHPPAPISPLNSQASENQDCIVHLSWPNTILGREKPPNKYSELERCSADFSVHVREPFILNKLAGRNLPWSQQ